MIEQLDSGPGTSGMALRLRPNRSASAAELAVFFSALALVTFSVALLAASQGNVYAPVFAVLDVGVVGFCFWLVRKGLRREEVIALTADSVIIRCRPGNAEARFHPYWVKLDSEPGRTRNAPARLVLRSHGRRVEVGAFLAEEERAELHSKLGSALAAARAGGEGFEPR